jgi:hypothetical protein
LLASSTSWLQLPYLHLAAQLLLIWLALDVKQPFWTCCSS